MNDPAFTPYVRDDYEPLQAAIVGKEDPLLFDAKDAGGKELKAILRDHNVHVFSPQDITAPPLWWPRDPLYVIGSQTFVSPQLKRRLLETRLMDDFLQDNRIPYTIMNPHGGDVLLPDANRIFLGFKQTIDEKQQSVCEEIARMTQRTVVDLNHMGIHLDTCLAPLPEGGAFFHAERITKASLLRLKQIFGTDGLYPVPTPPTDNQPVLNLFWINRQTVLAPANGIADRLRGMHYNVVEIYGLEELDGNVRCAIAPLVRGSIS